METPTTLAQFPRVIVRIDCAFCARKGAYRLARLAARYGPECRLDAVLKDLANDCRHGARCGARFMDLQQSSAPTAIRQRQPAREDIPQPSRKPEATSAVSKVPTLSDLRRPVLTIICPRCGCRAEHQVSMLLEQQGDVALVVLLKILTQDCERWNAQSVYELCGARFEMP